MPPIRYAFASPDMLLVDRIRMEGRSLYPFICIAAVLLSVHLSSCDSLPGLYLVWPSIEFEDMH